MRMVRNSSITLPITWSFLDADWQVNGAGYKTSTAFGFGLIDAEEFVQRSEKWKPIPEQLNCTFEFGGFYFRHPKGTQMTNFQNGL